MKKTILLMIVAAIYTTAIAQSRLVTAQYQKVNEPGIENIVPFAEKEVINTIEQEMQKLGYRGKEAKGYIIYKGVHLPQLGADNYDLYFKTERKSRKEKDATIVTLLISAGYEKFIGDSAKAPLINNAKDYLDKLTSKVAAFDLELQIIDQEVLVKKAAKVLAHTTDDGQVLQKKKAKLDEDISINMKEQTNNKTAGDLEQQILQTLMDKRKL